MIVTYLRHQKRPPITSAATPLEIIIKDEGSGTEAAGPPAMTVAVCRPVIANMSDANHIFVMLFF